MKIVDEKGRLFGKVNLIDLLVVVLIVAAAAAVAWKVLGSDTVTNAASPKYTATYTVLIEDMKPTFAESAMGEVGNQIVNDSKLVDAYITDVELRDSDMTEGRQDIYITVSGTASYAGYAYTVGSQDVRIGFSYIVKTASIELTGNICSLEITDG